MTPTEPRTVLIEPRFCGPARSGNGGYTTGLVASGLSSERQRPAQVRLRMPPPLDTPLTLDVDAAGISLTGPDGLVAEAVAVDPCALDDALVDPVGPDQARAAEASYRGLVQHPFPTCFACGPGNPSGLQLRPGRVGDGRTASTWTPADDLTEADGLVGTPYLWAALDCPGGWAIDLESRPSVLGQMTACIDAWPSAGEACVVMGRLLGEDGRKTFTASTLYDADGRVLARARHTWITVDPAAFV